jgi:prolyl 4-hydroxylase
MTPSKTDFELLEARAGAGDGPAQYELGLRLLQGDRAPRRPGHAVQWIVRAAEQGHAPALQTAAVFAVMGLDSPPDWPRALLLMRRAADGGDEGAKRQLSLLGADAFDFTCLSGAPAPRAEMESPRISVIEGLLPPAWCDWIVERAAAHLGRARVYAATGPATNDYRTNSEAVMRPERSDLVLEMANARIASVTGMPIGQQEATHVLHYEVGEQFKPHFDFIDPRLPYGRRNIELYGQRVLTVLIYLNDGFEGGETLFVSPDWRFKGAKGDAVMFWNVKPDGQADRDSMHAGLSPTRGEKWLFSKWVHDQTVPLL